MGFYYNPLNNKCKNIIGAVPTNSSITFNVFYDGNEKISLVLIDDETKKEEIFDLQKKENMFELTFARENSGLYFYYFLLNNVEKIGKNSLYQAESGIDFEPFQLSVYNQNFETPKYIKGGVIYQIFPDRFAKFGENEIKPTKILRNDWGGTPEFRPNKFGEVLNNDFFGGNLKGINQNLDYLQSLGVTVIYLNPIFEAYSNHRYDTGDYMKIDSLLGVEDDFKDLIIKAKEKGISIILDGVFNHTGSDSRYFNKNGSYDELGAFESRDSIYFKWYNFFEYPERYDAWWGIKTLPAINENDASYREFICGKDGVLRKWQRLGIGGYRLDVADELPDDFLKEIHKAIKEEDKNAIIIGEVWEDASNKIAYGKRKHYLEGDELDSAMNYPLKEGIINFVINGDVKKLVSVINMEINNYPKCVLDSLMNILGTHDTARILTTLANVNVESTSKEDRSQLSLNEKDRLKAINRLKIASVLNYFLFGVPCLYYGDEIGMEGYEDPFNRRCFDLNKKDDELLDFYKKLGEIRKNPVFVDGEYREIMATGGVFIFSRRKNNQIVYILANIGFTDYDIKIGGKLKNLMNDEVVEKIPLNKNSFYILAN